MSGFVRIPARAGSGRAGPWLLNCGHQHCGQLILADESYER